MIKAGGFEIRAVDTGRFRLDGGAMFGVVPKALWQKTDPADEKNRIEMHMRALYAEGRGRRILVDSGAGTKLDEKFVDIYAMEARGLREALGGEGIDPDSITDAVATHLHFDHGGGYTYYDSSGELSLALPNATHHVQRKQWEAAKSPNEKDRASFFPENFLPLEEAGKLDLLDGESEILPGVRVMPTEGHTPGHQIVLFGEGEGTVMYCGDLIPLASHVNLPWIMAYDHFPLSTLEEKKRLLGEAADNRWILFFEHDPKVAACRVTRNDRGRFEIAGTIETG
jgi:glyoxylase-like metal-dependent hydrolase (beta-lactamase superfamily II)